MITARFASLLRLLALLLAVAWLPACSDPEHEGLILWHSYRGAEAEALHKVVGDYLKAHPDEKIELAAVPNEAYANKKEVAASTAVRRMLRSNGRSRLQVSSGSSN